MSFWDRILTWISQGGTAVGASTPNDTPSMVEPALANNKPTTRMINSITLSSDMKTLYLIDNGRAVSFSLLDPSGIIIGTLNGQLTVVSASAMADQAVPEGGVTNEDTGAGDTPTAPNVPDTPGVPSTPAAPGLPVAAMVEAQSVAGSAARAVVADVRLPIESRKQWTLTYHEETGIMAIIGATDIDGSITGHEQTKTDGYAFKIKDSGKAVKLVRRGETLEIELVKA